MDVFYVLFAIAAISAALYALLTFGRRSATDNNDDRAAGVSTVEGAVFALLGFMLAFAFAGAQSRLETRQSAIVAEANAIGTAYLRSDLLPEQIRPTAQDQFRAYLNSRIQGAALLPNAGAAKAEWDRSHEIGADLWQLAIDNLSQPQDRALLLRALNDMFDRGTEREAAVRIHAPMPILMLLFVLAGLSAYLAGRAMRGTSGSATIVHRWVLAICFGSVIGVLLDMEHPRMGVIRLHSGDVAMLELQETLRPD